MEMFTPGKIPRSEPGTLHSLNLDNNQVEPGTIPRLNRGNIPAMENKAGKIPSYSWEKPCFSRDLRWLYISLLQLLMFPAIAQSITRPPNVFITVQAGRLGQLFQYMHKYNAESPKQGSKRFNSIVKVKYIADLGIIYLCSHYRTNPLSFTLHFLFPSFPPPYNPSSHCSSGTCPLFQHVHFFRCANTLQIYAVGNHLVQFEDFLKHTLRM